MAPVAASLAPGRVKTLLERVGYEVVEEDEYHWAFASRRDEVPVLVPRKVDLVPAAVMADVARKAGSEFRNYLYEIPHPWDSVDESPA